MSGYLDEARRIYDAAMNSTGPRVNFMQDLACAQFFALLQIAEVLGGDDKDVQDLAAAFVAGPGKLLKLPGESDLEPRTIGWLAYYSDRSGMALFFNEIDALRYAVDSSMSVTELKEGDVFDQLGRPR